MPFMSALSAGQVTQVRSDPQKFKHFLLVNPNDIVWQAQLDDTKSGENYASFDWDNEQSGSRSDVMEGMVCLITTGTSDFTDPVLRGRVRIIPDATTFYINESSTDIDDTMYITVLDDFDIMERLARVGPDGTKYKDYLQTWTNLPPTVDGLQSVYVDLTGAASVSWSFTPTATAHASGAAIDTWLWDVGDGTITVGTSASQNITVSFPNTSEHRWVHLTVTDDNNNSITFHFEVYTVDLSSSTALKLDADSFQITGSLLDGYNATVAAWADVALTDILDSTRCVIVSVDDYNGTATPIVSNIMMVGRFRSEESNTTGEEQDGVVQDGSFTIEGFATQLGRLVAQPVYIVDDASPDAWGEITSPNPTRAIVYFLFWHTTFLTLSSFSSDDLSAFTGQDWSLAEGTALDHINQQAETVNGQVFFAPAGESTVRRLASYTPTGSRGGLTTVFDFTTADATVFALPLEYGVNIGQVEAGAVVYNTTLDETTLKYIARAPAQSYGAGYESAQLNGQQLTADASDATARAEIAQRAADHLAYVNQKERITLTLMDGFWWLIPNLYQRFTFTLATSDTVRGRPFTDTDYWQLVDLSYAPSSEDGSRPVTATFERETTGENAGILVTRVADVNSIDFSLPGFGGYDYFPDDPLIDYPIDDPGSDLWSGFDVGPEPPGNNKQSPLGAEVLDVAMFANISAATTNIATFGEVYRVICEGDGIVGGTVRHYYDFLASQWDFTSGQGVYQSGAGWDTQDAIHDGFHKRRVAVERPWSSLTVTRVRLNYTYTKGATDDNGAVARRIQIVHDAGTMNDDKTFAAMVDGTNGDTWNGNLTGVTNIRCWVASSYKAAANYSGEAQILEVIIDYGQTARGDAFYKNYNLDQASEDSSTQRYAAGNGLLLNGAQPVGVGSYQGSHRYEFLETGNNAKFTFNFVDADYTDNDRNFIRVTVIGPNMSPSVL